MIPNYNITLCRPSGLSRYFIPATRSLHSFAPSLSITNTHDTEMPDLARAGWWYYWRGFFDKIIICFWTLGFAPFLSRGAVAPDKCPSVCRFSPDICEDISVLSLFFLLLPIPQIRLEVYGALYVKQLRVGTIENTVYVTQTEAFSKIDAVLQGES